MERGPVLGSRTHPLLSSSLHPSSVSALERPSHQDAPQWLSTPAARGRLCHVPFLPQEGGDFRAQVRHETGIPASFKTLWETEFIRKGMDSGA